MDGCDESAVAMSSESEVATGRGAKSGRPGVRKLEVRVPGASGSRSAVFVISPLATSFSPSPPLPGSRSLKSTSSRNPASDTKGRTDSLTVEIRICEVDGDVLANRSPPARQPETNKTHKTKALRFAIAVGIRGLCRGSIIRNEPKIPFLTVIHLDLASAYEDNQGSAIERIPRCLQT
ncbi:hypothetical protein Poly51_39490 [Rubripirellula tenax]|uniref:Uncharacterized protein n=1 Tax=Rubripirellula tenax TaxID=2528015 RepID=A0A5C6ESU4_9BACT|nr:hypothetical protein Poly51_39490 [Rubripirellula tenax]